MTDPTPVAPPPAVVNPNNSDMMVKVKVDRTEYTEPLSKLVASYQTQSAAEKRLADANALLSSRKAQIEFAEHFMTSAQRDPAKALEEVKTMLEMRLGRPISLPGQPSAGIEAGGGFEDATQVQDAQTKRLQQQYESLSQKVQSMEVATSTARTETEIKSALDVYPTFRGDDDASKRLRGVVELAVAGLANARPSASISDLVSEIHAGVAGLASSQATDTRNKLAERATELAGIPAGAGTPALTDQPAPPTVADVKSGKFRERLAADLKSWAAKQATAR